MLSKSASGKEILQYLWRDRICDLFDPSFFHNLLGCSQKATVQAPQTGLKVSLNSFHCLSPLPLLPILPLLSLYPVLRSSPCHFQRIFNCESKVKFRQPPREWQPQFHPKLSQTTALSVLLSASAEPAWTKMTFKTSAAYRLPPPHQGHKICQVSWGFWHSPAECRAQELKT